MICSKKALVKVLKNNFVLLIAFCAGFIISATAETFAETFDEPLWEAGFVTAAFSGPAYPLFVLWLLPMTALK